MLRPINPVAAGLLTHNHAISGNLDVKLPSNALIQNGAKTIVKNVLAEAVAPLRDAQENESGFQTAGYRHECRIRRGLGAALRVGLVMKTGPGKKISRCGHGNGQ